MLDYYPKFDVKNNTQIQDIPPTAIKQAEEEQKQKYQERTMKFWIYP